jgi:heptosyltransferase-2/heptosyltransferase-3
MFGKVHAQEVHQPSRILVVRVDHIGDAILTTPALAALRSTFRTAEITVVCGSWSVDVFRANPNINRVMIVDCPWWTRKRTGHVGWRNYIAFLRSVAALRRDKFDLMVDFRGDLRHVIWFGVFTGVPRLAGIDRIGTRSLLDISSRPNELDHEIDRSLSVARALGASEVTPPVTIPINQENRRIAARLVADHGSYIVLHTGGKLVNRWPIDRFIALLHALLQRQDLSILIIGGPEDEADACRLAELDPRRVLIAVNQLTIPSVAAVIESAAAYIGGDSGPMHLLHMVRTPAVLLFGPTPPGRFAPRRPGIHVIAARQCCSEDLHEICSRVGEGMWSACMQSLLLESVLDAVSRILNHTTDQAEPKSPFSTMLSLDRPTERSAADDKSVGKKIR